MANRAENFLLVYKQFHMSNKRGRKGSLTLRLTSIDVCYHGYKYWC